MGLATEHKAFDFMGDNEKEMEQDMVIELVIKGSAPLTGTASLRGPEGGQSQDFNSWLGLLQILERLMGPENSAGLGQAPQDSNA